MAPAPPTPHKCRFNRPLRRPLLTHSPLSVPMSCICEESSCLSEESSQADGGGCRTRAGGSDVKSPPDMQKGARPKPGALLLAKTNGVAAED